MFSLLGAAAALALGAAGFADARSPGQSTTVAAADGAVVVVAASDAGAATNCSFTDPCGPDTIPFDAAERVRLVTPASPNPDSCRQCFAHGTATAYTPRYVAVDYANPVAVLSVSGARSPEPALTLTGSRAVAVLARDGYDLGYSSRLTDHVCPLEPDCPSTPMLLSVISGLRMSMSGPAPSDERWEIVPIVAERAEASTDNAWYRFGETRSSTTQKVVVGFADVVFS